MKDYVLFSRERMFSIVWAPEKGRVGNAAQHGRVAGLPTPYPAGAPHDTLAAVRCPQRCFVLARRGYGPDSGRQGLESSGIGVTVMYDHDSECNFCFFCMFCKFD